MTEHFPTSRRALVYLAAAFGISWMAWGALVALVQAQLTSYGRWPFMTLYVLVVVYFSLFGVGLGYMMRLVRKG